MAAPMGSMLANIFQLYSVDNSDSLTLKDFLSVIKHNQIVSLKKDEDSSDLISHVHQCLNTSKNRLEGMVFLESIVKQCTTSVFQQNALTWIKLLFNILQGHCQPPVYSVCCHLLGNIIKHGTTFSDISRDIVNNLIPQLLPLLISAPAETRKAVFTCINDCIRTYPGPVGPFKHKLYTLILEEIDTTPDYKEVYECFALMAQCGPGGSQGIKHTEAWSQQCTSTLASLYETIDGLYADLDTDKSFSFEGRSLSLSVVQYSQPDRVAVLVSRWSSVTRCMAQLLSLEFPGMARVPVEDLLQVVCQCLSVNTHMLMSKATSQRCLLAGFIQELHVRALHLLQTLIILCGSNIMLHGTLIVSLLSQTLTWTHTIARSHTQPYGYLRHKAYGVMSTWMKTLDGCSGITAWETTLVKELLHDCLPFTDTLKLKSGSKQSDSSSKKAKKKKSGYQELSEGISSQRKSHPLANCDLVTAALDALYWLMMTCGSELSKKSMQSIHEFIVRTLVTIQHARAPAVPYTNPGCRRGLYQVLQACVLTPHTGAPSPLHCALGLFSTGRRDKNTEVSAVCLTALKVCEALIHPRAPCLNAPIVCENPILLSDTRLNSAGTTNVNDAGAQETCSATYISYDVPVIGNGNRGLAGAGGSNNDAMELNETRDTGDSGMVKDAGRHRNEMDKSSKGQSKDTQGEKRKRGSGEDGEEEDEGLMIGHEQQSNKKIHADDSIVVSSGEESDSDIVELLDNGDLEDTADDGGNYRSAGCGSTVVFSTSDGNIGTVNGESAKQRLRADTADVVIDDSSDDGGAANMDGAGDNLGAEKAKEDSVTQQMLSTFVDAGPDSE